MSGGKPGADKDKCTLREDCYTPSRLLTNLMRLVMGLLPFHSGVSAKYGELKDSGTEGWATGPSIPPPSMGCLIQLVIETSTKAPAGRDWFYLAFAGLSVWWFSR